MILSAHQQATMPSLKRTRALARNLHRITGEPIAILKCGALYWTACPADRATYWQPQIERGDVRVVETIQGNAVLG